MAGDGVTYDHAVNCLTADDYEGDGTEAGGNKMFTKC